MFLPQCRMRMRPMTKRLLARRNQNETPILQSLHFALGNSQLGRIDKVIARIDPHHRRFDLFELRRRIVVPRCVHLVEEIVGI